ncbi:Helicase C and SNF2 N domain containing protein [Trichuris trichiura]|uniref:Helicase C and SNF2 N domain containing protein n=1 Tax=Trichuris trichiura TaxID=36087 RepID=A0A077ZLG8_TRITR|nr:Helicase C and SNF2 N domain containing protein [Trichuris trichiura]
MEMERRKRIEERQKLVRQLLFFDPHRRGYTLRSNFVLEMSEDGKKPAVVVHEQLANCMKAHQRRGVQFLYDNTIESFKKINSAGSGCILAHSMGLGKSLQVVAYLHVVMTNELLGVKSALILSPLGVVLNWKNEFDLWLFNKGLNLCLKSSRDRIMLLKNWKAYGGVLIMGYCMFRIMVNNKRNKNHKAVICETLLDPGPDVVICDEAHILKNDSAGISKALSQIKTKRRICLTGTPLQNSLFEYYCMVNFVKPNLLGTKKNFNSTFVHPIRNGQMSDSTPTEVRVMKRRSHVLHKLLSGFVQRVGYESLEEPLFMKHEYILYVRLSPEQVNLYNHYLDVVVENLDIKSLKARNSLFQDFQSLQLVWNHPRALLLHEADSYRKVKDEEELTSTTSSSSCSSSSSSSSSSSTSSKSVKSEKDNLLSHFSPPLLNAYNRDEAPSVLLQPTDDDVLPVLESEHAEDGITANEIEEVEKPAVDRSQWFKAITAELDCDRLELSGKLVLLFKILEKCAEIGDKLLVFSQSLIMLNLIEKFLEAKVKRCLLPTGRWVRGMDYLRLDGSTPAEVRKRIALRFNDTNDLRCRLLLVSIRAGSLGINLIGSNRVVIFDANWNPTHEMQAMFRVIRLGQTKPVYVYRFIAQETMESVIYGRQVVKQSLAYRVVDDWQIERHFSGSDLLDLYSYNPTRNVKASLVLLPNSINWTKYHEHDSLLKNIVEETLTDEEMKAAWAEYEMEKQQTDLEKRIAILHLRAANNMVTTDVPMLVDTLKHQILLQRQRQLEQQTQVDNRTLNSAPSVSYSQR